METTTIYNEVEGIGEVALTGKCYIENDGIGSYDFGGHTEYDRGEDTAVCYEIGWNRHNFTDEENADIAAYVAKYHDEIKEEIEAKHLEYYSESSLQII